jgi:hypothetical protein
LLQFGDIHKVLLSYLYSKEAIIDQLESLLHPERKSEHKVPSKPVKEEAVTREQLLQLLTSADKVLAKATSLRSTYGVSVSNNIQSFFQNLFLISKINNFSH